MTPKKTTPATAFKAGQSGNPKGKPKGARNHATRAALALMEGGADEITRAVIDAAKAGNLQAAFFILGRVAPPAKERPVQVDLPSIETVAGVAAAQAAILSAVAAGTLTPTEGSTLAAIVEARRKALETEELEARIAALEADHGDD